MLDGTKTLIKKNLAFNWGNRDHRPRAASRSGRTVAALETRELMQEVRTDVHGAGRSETKS